MEDLNTISQKKSLQIELGALEFGKNFHYFITAEIEGDSVRKRTDICDRVSNPIFAQNKFSLPLFEEKLQSNPVLLLKCFIVSSRIEGISDEQLFGEAKLLGQCSLDLNGLLPQLLDYYNTSIRRKLEFKRLRNDGTGAEATVGRGFFDLKISGDYNTKFDVSPHQQQNGPIKALGEIHNLPAEKEDFAWRIRCHLKNGENMPLNQLEKDGLPSSFLEFGWSDADLNLIPNQPIFLDEMFGVKSFMVEKTINPSWNHQVIFNNPTEVLDSRLGYFVIKICDLYQNGIIDQITIAMNSFKPFVPVNLCISGTHKANPTKKYKVFLELTLEQRLNGPEDSLIAIPIFWTDFVGIPQENFSLIKSFAFCLTTDNFVMQEIVTIEINTNEGKNASAAVQQVSKLKQRIFTSPWLLIPPTPGTNLYKAIGLFTIPKSYLNGSLSLYLLYLGANDKFPTNRPIFPLGTVKPGVFGSSLLKLLQDQNQKPLSLTFDGWPRENQLQGLKIVIQLGCMPLDYETFKPAFIQQQENFAIKNIIEQEEENLQHFLNSQKPTSEQDLQKWVLLAKELDQKQEIISRMMRDSDEKAQALKLVSSQVLDLRRTLQMMQSENTILRRNMASEEVSQLQSLVNKEISHMSNEDLKVKVIKLAQAYRQERIRNEYFEKALKSANQDLAQTKRVQTQLEQLEEKHSKLRQALTLAQQEAQKSGIYKDTIKKQEKVIVKLEQLLDKTLKETQRAREGMIEFERLKTENLELQAAMGTNQDYELADQLKQQIKDQEAQIEELKNQLVNQESGEMADWEDEKIGFELQIEQLKARINAQDEYINEKLR